MKNSLRFFLALCLGLSLLLSGCGTTAGDSQPTWQPFEGSVVYVPRYRGFWGIQARKIGKINPIDLPMEFHEKDLKISGEVLLHPDYGSVKKWGTVGEVRNLKRAE